MSKFVVGITGGIASGKSALSRVLEERKLPVIDADIVARKVVDIGSVGEALLHNEFSSAFSNGVLDRKKLRNMVFGNSFALEKLNAITHPLIAFEVAEQIKNIEDSVIFFVCPLLFESGFNSLCDYTVSVSAKEEIQLERLIARDGISKELAQEMIASQLTNNKRNALADEVIDNNGNVIEFESKVGEFISKLLHRIKVR